MLFSFGLPIFGTLMSTTYLP